MKFKDKVIWITGAASGIGEALAYQAVEYGARLVLSDIEETKLETVTTECIKKGAEALALPLDLSDRKSIEGAVPLALEKFGRVDVLINNGGISMRALTWDTSLDVDYRIMNINYFGAVILTKALLPGMIERGEGYIAATSTITGKFGFPLRSAYSASKHALQGFFETLGIELTDKNISVTIVMPGRVRTNISLNALNADGSRHGKMSPGQAGGMSPEKCAKKYLNAVHKRKREVLIGGWELISVHARRFVPWLFFRLAGKFDPS